jgi:hypothetical protein
MWRAVMLLDEDPNNPSHAAGQADWVDSNQPDGDPLHAEVEDSLVKKTLMWLEPLDKAVCALDPACDWEKESADCYSEYRIYKFMRKEFHIPEDWPPVGQNPDDFSANAPEVGAPGYKRVSDMVPKTRVAARLHRKNEQQVLAELHLQSSTGETAKLNKKKFAQLVRQQSTNNEADWKVAMVTNFVFFKKE